MPNNNYQLPITNYQLPITNYQLPKFPDQKISNLQESICIAM
ncbi:hypothetical protein [Fischerella thermalis]